MNTFDAFVQSMRRCANPKCGKTFTLYVDCLPSQDMTHPKTYWTGQCPHCQTATRFYDGAFTHVKRQSDLPKDAVHAQIVEAQE